MRNPSSTKKGPGRYHKNGTKKPAKPKMGKWMRGAK